MALLVFLSHALRLSPAIIGDITVIQKEKLLVELEEKHQKKMLDCLTESSLIRFKISALEKFPGIDPLEIMSTQDKILDILKDDQDMVTFMVCNEFVNPSDCSEQRTNS